MTPQTPKLRKGAYQKHGNQSTGNQLFEQTWPFSLKSVNAGAPSNTKERAPFEIIKNGHLERV